MTAKAGTTRDASKPLGKESSTNGPSAKISNPHANRETVESIIVAVILAFLFRGFIAEAFVIPTGSMAPTLQGNHKDVFCRKCGCQFQASASMENDDDGDGLRVGEVRNITCPICRYVTDIEPSVLEHATFSGDRIVVSKFSYQLSDPKRWDVIVFKFPGNAKQNYIKRLVGLPNETIRFRHGDVFTKKVGESDFHIERKPDFRQLAMLQLVDDTAHVAEDLVNAGWPSRWQPSDGAASRWTVLDGGRDFAMTTPADREDWLRYRHIVPTEYDWDAIKNGDQPPHVSARGQLINDFYAYNASNSPAHLNNGNNWVGDLAVEAEVQVLNDQGEILLDLVEGGTHYRCQINVADGSAKLLIDLGRGDFSDEAGTVSKSPVAGTTIKGAGKYDIRFANVDNELRLWVNDSLVKFDSPTTYSPVGDVVPKSSADDPGDLQPVGIGSKGAQFRVPRMRVLRDIYYIAAQPGSPDDYDVRPASPISQILANPDMWASTNLFESRATIEFDLDDDQFFPCGDNSPESQDARIWHAQDRYFDGERLDVPNYVQGNQLTGEALLIYYPHPWNSPFRIYLPARLLRPFGPWVPVGITPNFKRMGLIR